MFSLFGVNKGVVVTSLQQIITMWLIDIMLSGILGEEGKCDINSCSPSCMSFNFRNFKTFIRIFVTNHLLESYRNKHIKEKPYAYQNGH
jgi:hypothetical protein